MIQGSANYTRRNIGNYNLETNVLIRANNNTRAIIEAKEYFEDVWNNTPGRVYSTAYETYADDSLRNKILYRIMEDLGTSTF